MFTDNKKQEVQHKPKIIKKVAIHKTALINQTPISQILQQLHNNSLNTQQNQTKALRIIRSHKLREERRIKTKQIYQDCLKPANAIPRVFSSSKPLNVGDHFLDIKQKSKLLLSERAFNHSANGIFKNNIVISGVFRERIVTESQKQKKDFVNRKFQDFDQIVTEQTGPMRILMKQKKLQSRYTSEKKPIYSGKLQSKSYLFSSFEADKNNFYKQVTHAQTSNNCVSSKLKTLASLNTSPSSKKYSFSNKCEKKNRKQLMKTTLSRNFSSSTYFD